MLASARRGHARSGFGAFEMADGSVQVFARGAFASDEERCAKIASEALDHYCYQHHIAHPKVEAHCVLPPGLRKA